MEVTAWYDDVKRAEVMKSINEIYYYMVYATTVEERRNWALEYTNKLIKQQELNTNE